MIPPPPRSTSTHTLVPEPTLFRSVEAGDGADLHAVHVLALDAGFGDDVGHCGSLRCVAGLEGSGTDRGAKDWGLSGRKNMPSWKLSAMRSARSMKMTATSRSEEHTSELQSLMRISYAVFCLKKKQ